MEPSPFDAQHPDPLGHAASEAARKVVELISVAVMIAQSRQQRRYVKAARDEAEKEAWLAEARTTWSPVLDAGWRADAPPLDAVTRAWAAALPYEHEDAGARQALEAAEPHMRELHPRAMGEFDRRTSTGADRGDAMLAAVDSFARHPRPGIQGGPPELANGEADIISRLLGDIARLASRKAEAGGQLNARDIAEWLRRDLPPGMADLVSQGVREGNAARPAGARPGARPAAARSVAGHGPAAVSWLAPVGDGVAATFLRRSGGGRHRRTAQRHSAGDKKLRSPRQQL